MMLGSTFNPSMKDLTNRLASFVEWPNNVAVKPKDLAESGFYYVGRTPNVYDSVTCFSCGGTVSGWQVGDIPDERHRRVSRNRCEFLKNRGIETLDTPSRNSFDPIDNDMENEQQRLLSFQRNNGWRGAVPPYKLAAAGFYYTGIDDEVKCFACGTGLKAWLPEDDPVTEHLRVQPNCTFISRFRNRYSVTTTTNASSQEPVSLHLTFEKAISSVGRKEPSSSFRAQFVVPPRRHEPTSRPNYSSEHARLHSFINWPKSCPVQPKELIDAGFYYTGNGDEVQCFKCQIILAGWEPQDTPWGEHEKWSKDCPLVREHQRRRNPHSPILGPGSLPQEQTWKTPTQSKPSVKTIPSETEDKIKESNLIRLPSEQSERPKSNKQNRPTEGGSEAEIFYLQKGVQRLLENKQYDFETISEAIQQKTKIEGASIQSMDELVEAIEQYQTMSKTKSTLVDDADMVPLLVDDIPSTSNFSLSVNPDALHEQVQKMEDAHRCKICLDAEIGIVFLPCGHLVCCPNCSLEIQSKRDSLCPICRRHIDSTIRTYLP